MVDNAENYFKHTDGDGDSIELVATADHRMTLTAKHGGGQPPIYVYLDAGAVDQLIDGLNRWRGRQVTDTATPAVSGPTAGQRREALRMSVQCGFASDDVVLDRADGFAHWLATGERAGVLRVSPVDMNVIAPQPVAEAGLRRCAGCGHPYHGRVGCGSLIYGSGVTQIRCSCTGEKA
jgi:hypothetical protein